MRNPWNLTAMEERGIEALIAEGGCKGAAARLRIRLSSLSRVLARAAEKMGCESNLHAVLKYYLWQQKDKGMA